MTSNQSLSSTLSGLACTDGPSESSSTESSVSCRSVTVRYGRTVAVDEVTFEVRPGEVLGLLGPNGAGKTSLIRALTTMLPMAGGEATIAGIDRRHPDLIRSRIGVLPENSGYPNHQMAIEYVSYHERGLCLLEDMGLGDRAYSRIRTFSRGMRQRLGIARALINQPDVLFLDEPTLGLDPAGQEEVLRRIRSIATDIGATVILTSHLLDEVNRVCDRVVIMNKGRVVATGSVDEVVQQAGLARSVHTRVAVSDVDRTISRLSQVPEIVATQQVASQPGEIRVEFTNSGAVGTNLVAAALISVGIPMLSLELKGATLNEAFLSPNPPKDTDGRREGSGRGWVRELQGRWPGVLG